MLINIYRIFLFVWPTGGKALPKDQVVIALSITAIIILFAFIYPWLTERKKKK